MREKKGRISITWTEEQSRMMERIARNFEAELKQNDIEPFTTRTPDGSRKANASGIILYLMMEKCGKLKSGDE